MRDDNFLKNLAIAAWMDRKRIEFVGVNNA
jgi:hypothetical protein